MRQPIGVVRRWLIRLLVGTHQVMIHADLEGGTVWFKEGHWYQGCRFDGVTFNTRLPASLSEQEEKE